MNAPDFKKSLKPFHTVCHRREIGGTLVTQTYSIYKNNKPYLKPPRGQKLPRRAAQFIRDFLNGDGIPLRSDWKAAK